MADDIMNNAAEMDWDSPISADAAKQNLPPVGEYGFTVVDFERGFSKAGKKMATLSIELDQEAQFWKITDYLVLTQNMEWRLAQFFESVGLKKPDEKLERMPWDKVLGASGKLKIKYEEYNGKTSVKVDRYILSEAAQAPTKPDMSDMPFEV